MDKTDFLRRVRGRLANAERLSVAVPDDWAIEIANAVERFEAELTAVGGHFHHLAGDGLGDLFDSIFDGLDSPTVLVTREDGVPPGVPDAVAAAGGSIVWWPETGRDSAASADVGVTSVLWGVAETGTLAVAAAPPGGRAPSLLPPVHVAFVPARRILRTTAELFRAIGSIDPAPSNLVLITGPSKSADIGMELTLGVHGPGEVHAVVLGVE